MEGFTGDPRFVAKDYPPKMYSKLRSSMGGVYVWRARQAKLLEKARMLEAADFAFRQAFALCPMSPEAVFRYVNLLVEEKRHDEALHLAGTAAKIDLANGQLDNLVREIERMRKP
jgi:hypothetical protein